MLALWAQWAHATAAWQLFWLQALMPPVSTPTSAVVPACPACAHPMAVADQPRPHWECPACGLIRLGEAAMSAIESGSGGPDRCIGANPGS